MPKKAEERRPQSDRHGLVHLCLLPTTTPLAPPPTPPAAELLLGRETDCVERVNWSAWPYWHTVCLAVTSALLAPVTGGQLDH